MEDAELVADPVSQRRNLQRGHRIEKTCSQPSQAAVTQTRLLFLVEQLVEIEPQLGHRLTRLRQDAQID